MHNLTPNPFIVGITGASGSGKTTFINLLEKKLPVGMACFISLDNYYKPREFQPKDEEGIENYDTLESIDIEGFIYDIKALLSGETLERTEYDFNNPDFIPKKIILKPAKVIILEGVFLFSYPVVYGLIDLKLYIEAPEHLRITRRLQRDLEERGYSTKDTIYWLQNHVEPAYKKFILPQKEKSDIIVPNVSNLDMALEVLGSFLIGRG